MYDEQVIKVLLDDEKSISRAEKRKQKLENSGYTLFTTSAGFTTATLIYRKYKKMKFFVEPKVKHEDMIVTWTPEICPEPEFWGIYYKDKEGLTMHSGFDWAKEKDAREAADKLNNLWKELEQ